MVQASKEKKSRKSKGRVSDIDKCVGQRIKAQRHLSGVSQIEMADVLGVTFQQVQKYESGANRVSAGRLYEVSRFLNVPVSYFFEDCEEKSDKKRTHILNADIFEDRETIEMVRYYHSIKDKKLQRNLLSFMKTLSKESV